MNSRMRPGFLSQALCRPRPIGDVLILGPAANGDLALR
jgi:hypothetical protein